MSSPTECHWKRPKWSRTIAACSTAAAMLLASCGGEQKCQSSRPHQTRPSVSVVVAPVVQKTVPLFTELTARTDATERWISVPA